VPRGRVIEIFGPESSGKTTLSLQIIAEAQKLGGIAAFVDAEHALDAPTPRSSASTSTTSWCRSPTTASRRWRIVEVLIRSNGVDVVVVDSVARWCRRPKSKGEMGDAQMGLQARLMSQALRKLTGACPSRKRASSSSTSCARRSA
jgi:recombination protein RecA